MSEKYHAIGFGTRPDGSFDLVSVEFTDLSECLRFVAERIEGKPLQPIGAP
jgi:hypothetical protein